MAMDKAEVFYTSPVEERGKGNFAGDLSRSVLVLLKTGLIASLKQHIGTDPTDANPLLQRPHILRDLRFYETGLNQISILARAERTTLALLCLDLMPGHLYPTTTTPDYVISDKSMSYEQFALALNLHGPHEAIQELVTLFLVDCFVCIFQEYEGGLPQIESILVSWAIHYFQRYSKAKDLDQLSPVSKEILFRWSDLLHYLTPWAANLILTRLDAILHSTVIVDRGSLNSVPAIITGLSKIRLEPLNAELSTTLEALVNKLFAFAAFTFSISNSHVLLNSAWQNLISNFLLQKCISHLITKVAPTPYGDVAIQLTPNSPFYDARVNFFDAIIANFKSHKRLQPMRGEFRDYHPAFNPKKTVASLTSTSFYQNLILHGANTGAPCLRASPHPKESDTRYVGNDSMPMIHGSPIGYFPYTFRPMGLSPAFQASLTMHADLSISEVLSTFFKKPSHMGPVLITTIYHAPRTLEQLAINEHKYSPKSTLVALNAIYLVVSNFQDSMKARMNASPASFDVPKGLMELLIVLDRVIYGFYVQSKLKGSTSGAATQEAITPPLSPSARTSASPSSSPVTSSSMSSSVLNASARQTNFSAENEKSRSRPKLRSVLDMVRMMVKIMYHCSFPSFIPAYRCWMVIETQSEFRSMLLASARKDHQTRVLCLSALFEAISNPEIFGSNLPEQNSNDNCNHFLYQWFCDVAVCGKDMSVDVSMLGKIELVGALCLSLPVPQLHACGLTLLHHMRLAETDKTTFHSILEQKTTSLINLAMQRISRQEPQLFLTLIELSAVEVWERMKTQQSLWWYFLAELFKAYSVADSLLNIATTHINTNFDALGTIMNLFEHCSENSPSIPSYLLLLFSLPSERQADFSGRVLASPQFHLALNSAQAKSAIFAVQSSSFDVLPLVVEYASSICSHPHATNPYHVLVAVSMIGELLQSQLALFEPFSSAQRNDKVNPKQRAFKKHQHLVDQIANLLSHALVHMSPDGALASLSLTVRTFCFDHVVQLIIALALVQSKTFDIQKADTEDLVQDILGAKLIWLNRAEKLAICHFLQVELFNHNVACHDVLFSEPLDYVSSTSARKGSVPGISVVDLCSSSSSDLHHSKHISAHGTSTPIKGNATGGTSTPTKGHEKSKSSGSSGATSSAIASLISSPAPTTVSPLKVKSLKTRQPFLSMPLTHNVLEILSKPLPIGLEELSSHSLVAWECLAQIGVLNELDIPLFAPHSVLQRSKSSGSTLDSKSVINQPSGSTASVLQGGGSRRSSVAITFTENPPPAKPPQDVSEVLNRQFTPRGSHSRPNSPASTTTPISSTMSRLLDLDVLRYSILKWMLHYQRHDFKVTYDLVFTAMLQSTVYRKNYVIALAAQLVPLPEESRTIVQPTSDSPISAYPETLLATHVSTSSALKATSTSHLASLPRIPERIFSLPLHQQLIFPCVLLADSDRIIRRLARDMLRAIIVEQKKPLPVTLSSEAGANTISDIEGVALETAGEVATLFEAEAPQMICEFLEKIRVASPLEQIWLAQLVIAFGVHVAPLTDRILGALYDATQNIDSRLDAHLGRVWGSLVHTIRPTWRNDLKLVVQYLIRASSTRSTISKILLAIYEVSDEHSIRITSILLGLLESKSILSGTSSQGNSAPESESSLDSQQAIEAVATIIDSSPERLLQTCPRLTLYCLINHRSPIFASLLATILERASLSPDIPIPVRIDICHTASLIRSNGLAHAASLSTSAPIFGNKIGPELHSKRRGVPAVSGEVTDMHSLETNFDEPSDWDFPTYVYKIVMWLAMWDTNFVPRFFEVVCEYVNKCGNKDYVHNQSNLATAFTLYRCLLDDIHWNTKSDDVRDQTAPLIILLTDLATRIELEHSGELVDYTSSTAKSPEEALEKSRYQESLQVAETLASFARFVLSASSAHSFWALVALLHSHDKNLFSQALRAFWYLKFPSLVLIEGGKFDVIPVQFWKKTIRFVSVVDHLLDCLSQESVQPEEANVLALALTLARSDLKLISGKRPLLLRLFISLFAWLNTVIGTSEYASTTTRFICHSFVSLLFHMQQKSGNAQATTRNRTTNRTTKIPLSTLLGNLHSSFEKYIAKPTQLGLSAMVEALSTMYLPEGAKSLIDTLCTRLASRPSQASGILILARCFLELSSSSETNVYYPKLIGQAFEASLDPRYNIAFELQKLVEVAPLVSALSLKQPPATRKGSGSTSKSANPTSSPRSSRRRGSKESKELIEDARNLTEVSELGRRASDEPPETALEDSDTKSMECVAAHLLERVIDALEGEATGLRTIASRSNSSLVYPVASLSPSSSTSSGSIATSPPVAAPSDVIATRASSGSSNDKSSLVNSRGPVLPAVHTDDDAATEYDASAFMAKQKKRDRIRKSAVSQRRILDTIVGDQWDNNGGMLGGSEDSSDGASTAATFKSEYQPITASPAMVRKKHGEPGSPRFYLPLQHNMYHLLRVSEHMCLEVVQEALLQLFNDHMPKSGHQNSIRTVKLSSLAEYFPFVSALIGNLPSCLKFLLNRTEISEETHDRLIGPSAPIGIFAIVSLTSPSIYLLIIPPSSQKKEVEDNFMRMCYKIVLELGKTHFMFFSEPEIQSLIEHSHALSDNDSEPDSDQLQLPLSGKGVNRSPSNPVVRPSSSQTRTLSRSELIRRASSTSLEAISTLVSSKTSMTPLNIANASNRARALDLTVSSAFQVPLPSKMTLGAPVLASGATNLILLPEKIQQNTKLDMTKQVFTPDAFATITSKKVSRSLAPENNLESFVQSWLNKGGRIKFFPDFVNDHQQMVDFFRRYRPEVQAAVIKVEKTLKDRLAEIEHDARSSIAAMIDYYLKTIAPLEYRIVNQFTSPGMTDAFDELRETQIKHFSNELDECCPPATFTHLRRKYYESLWIINYKDRKGTAKGEPRISNSDKANFIERMLTVPKFYKKCLSKISDRAPMTLFVTENLGNQFLPLVTPEIQFYIQSSFNIIAQNTETLFAASHTDSFVSWAKRHFELDAKQAMFDCLVPAYNELIAANTHEKSTSQAKLSTYSRESSSATASLSSVYHSSHTPGQTPPPLVLTIYKFAPLPMSHSSPAASPKSPKRSSLMVPKSPESSTSTPPGSPSKQHRRVATDEKKARNAQRRSGSAAGAKSFELTYVEEKVEGSPRMLYSSYYLTHAGDSESSAAAKLVEARSKPLWILTQQERLLQVVTLKDGSVFSFIYNTVSDETVIYVCYAKDMKSTTLRKTEASRFPGHPSAIALSPRQKLLAVVIDKTVRVMSVDWEDAVWSKLFDFEQDSTVLDIRFAGSSRLVVFTTTGAHTYMRFYFLELVSSLKSQNGATFAKGPLITIPSTPGRLLTPNGQYLMLIDELLATSVYDLEPFLKTPKLEKDFATSARSTSSSVEHSTEILPEDLAHAEKNSNSSDYSLPVNLNHPVASLMLAPKFHNFVLPSKIGMITISGQVYLVGVMDDSIECLALENLEGTANTARSMSLVPRLSIDIQSVSPLETPHDPSSQRKGRPQPLPSPSYGLMRLLDVHHELTQSKSMSSRRLDLMLHFVINGMTSAAMAKQSCRQLFKSLVSSHEHAPPDLHLFVSSQAALEALRAPLVLRYTTKMMPQPESLEQWITRLISLVSPRIVSLDGNSFSLTPLSMYQLPQTPRSILKQPQISLDHIFQATSPLSSMHVLMNNWQGPVKVISTIGTETRYLSITKALNPTLPTSSAPVVHESLPGAYMSSFINTSTDGGPCLFIMLEVVLPVVEMQMNLSEKLLILFACLISTAVIWHTSQTDSSSLAMILKSLDEIGDLVPNLTLNPSDPQFDVVSSGPFTGKLFVLLSDVMASAQAAEAATEFKETYKKAKRAKKRGQDFTSRMFNSQSPSLFLFSDTSSVAYQSSIEAIQHSIDSLDFKATNGEPFATYLCSMLTIVEHLQAHLASVARDAAPKKALSDPVKRSEPKKEIPRLAIENKAPSKSDMKRAPLDHLLFNLEHAVQFGVETEGNGLTVGVGSSISLIDDPCVEIGDLKLFDCKFDMYSIESVNKIVEALKRANVPKLELHYELQGLYEFLVQRRLTRVATWIEEQLALIGISGEAFQNAFENASPFTRRSSVNSTGSSDQAIYYKAMPGVNGNSKQSGVHRNSPSKSSAGDDSFQHRKKQLLDEEIHGGGRSATTTTDEDRRSTSTTSLTSGSAYLSEVDEALQKPDYDTEKLKCLARQSDLLRDLLTSRWEICEIKCSGCSLECNLPLFFHESHLHHGHDEEMSTSKMNKSSSTPSAAAASSSTANGSASKRLSGSKAMRGSGNQHKVDPRTADMDAALSSGLKVSVIPTSKQYREAYMHHSCCTDHQCGVTCRKCANPCAHPFGHGSIDPSTTEISHECNEKHVCPKPCQFVAFKLRGCAGKCCHTEGHIPVGTTGTPHDCGQPHGCNQYCAFCDQYCKHLFNEKHKTHACAETECKHSCEIHKNCSRPCTLGHQHTEMHFCGVKS